LQCNQIKEKENRNNKNRKNKKKWLKIARFALTSNLFLALIVKNEISAQLEYSSDLPLPPQKPGKFISAQQIKEYIWIECMNIMLYLVGLDLK